MSNEYFNVLTTPEQELAVFLTDVIGLPKADVTLVQQGGALLIVTQHRPQVQHVLIMGDKEQIGLWHVVSENGFRGFVSGTFSLLTVLHGIGVAHLWGEHWIVTRSRYAKARRLISAAAETVDPGDVERGAWGDVAKAAGEKEPSSTTIAIIEQLLKEES